MIYLRHLGANFKVALKCFVLVLFHLAHGLLPLKLTDHKYWRLGNCEKSQKKKNFWERDEDRLYLQSRKNRFNPGIEK